MECITVFVKNCEGCPLFIESWESRGIDGFCKYHKTQIYDKTKIPDFCRNDIHVKRKTDELLPKIENLP